METTLYIVRHGETEWNRKGLLQGQLNSELTPEGIERTEDFRKEITDLNPDIVYSSDQKRAVITAEILTRDLDRTMKFHSGLREMNFGAFQGLSWDSVKVEMPDIFARYREDNPDFVVPGGESHNQFHRRVTEALQQIIDENPGKKILIVSHGGSINKMICYAREMAPSGNRFFRSKNLALNIFKYKDGNLTVETPVELLEYAAIH